MEHQQMRYCQLVNRIRKPSVIMQKSLKIILLHENNKVLKNINSMPSFCVIKGIRLYIHIFLYLHKETLKDT